jgi:hypothetical protein
MIGGERISNWVAEQRQVPPEGSFVWRMPNLHLWGMQVRNYKAISQL